MSLLKRIWQAVRCYSDLNFYSLFFREHPGFVYWRDGSGDLLGCNKQFLQLAGQSSLQKLIDNESQLNLPWLVKMRKDDLAFLHGANCATSMYRIHLAAKDSFTIYLEANRVFFQSKKRKNNIMYVVMNDITQLKVKERQLLNKIKELKEFDKIKDDIIDGFPGLIYLKNINLQYVLFNKNVVKLSGLTADELYGKTDKELPWGSDEADAFEKDDRQIMDEDIVKITEHTIPIKRIDGQNMTVKTEKIRFCDHDGKLIGILGVALDITEQKMLEERLQQEKEKVESLSQAQAEFIRHMEHDIRTPFTGIYTITETLEQTEQDPSKKKMLTMLRSASKELLDYCNGILDFSRIESSTFPVVDKKFNLQNLLTGLIEMEMPIATNKKLELIHVYDDKIPNLLRGDEFRIKRIVINLISNAIKFTDGGSVTVKTKVAKTNKKHIIIELSVSDTGIGIPADKIDYVFEKFTRLSPANRGFYKGSGLGLNAVKQLTEEINGQVDVKSEVGVGSCFTITFPLTIPLDASDSDYEEKE